MTLPTLVLLFSALLGLVFGSFLNVCIARLPAGGSVISPRSRCSQCRTALRWFDNVPLVSFVMLRRRCRSCGLKIAWQYPLVEVATAAWFCWSFVEMARTLQSPPATALLVYLPAAADAGTAIFGFLLLGLMIMDWQTQLLPDLFTLGGIAAGLLSAAAEAMLLRSGGLSAASAWHGFRDRILGAALGFLLPWSIGQIYHLVRHRRGIGLGDSKMLAMIGAFLGIGPMLFALLLGVLLAATFGIGLLLQGRATATTRLPFGSFLAVGGFISAVIGETAVDWYLSLFAR